MRRVLTGFSDGACKGNPGPGGWGIVMITENEKVEVRWTKYGGSKHTTNQEMELCAFYEMLSLMPKNNDITIYTDSMYVLKPLINGKFGCIAAGPGRKAVFSGYMSKWIANGWKKVDGGKISHINLWKCVVAECQLHIYQGSSLKLEWVKGHSGVEGNELADQLANLGVPKR